MPKRKHSTRSPKIGQISAAHVPDAMPVIWFSSTATGNGLDNSHRGVLSSTIATLAATMGQVSVEQISSSLEILTRQMNVIWGRVGSFGGKFELDEIQVSFEISPEGKLNLLGSGVGLNGKGAFALTFKRKP